MWKKKISSVWQQQIVVISLYYIHLFALFRYFAHKTLAIDIPNCVLQTQIDFRFSCQRICAMGGENIYLAQSGLQDVLVICSIFKSLIKTAQVCLILFDFSIPYRY